MERVGAPQDVYPGKNTPIWIALQMSQKSRGVPILSGWYCRESIFTMKTPCCGHTSHCRCFQKWVVVQFIGKYTIADSDASIQNGGAR